jgi:O-antigen biosynthesis protein
VETETAAHFCKQKFVGAMPSRRQTPSPLVSVIIVNYNVRDFLLQAVASLQKALRGIPSEIFVADNASDDGSVEAVRERFPKVKIIASAQNLGFAKANNAALSKTRGRYILLINPDTMVQEDTIRVMLDFFEDHPEAGMAGCKILNPDGSFQLACRRSFPTPSVALARMSQLSKLFPKSKFLGRYNLTYLSTEETYPVEAISGSFMMLRREVYEQAGGFDEAFFMYGEDIDWCYRIRQAGWQIYYVHATQIIHYKGESTRRSNVDEIRTFYDAMHLFVQKHFSSSFLFLAVLRFAIASAAVLASLNSFVRSIKIALIDFFMIDLSLLLAEYLRRGDVFLFPQFAVPIVFTVPALIVLGHLYAAGVYTYRRMSIARSIAAILIAYVVIAALVAFFKNYAFSRMIILMSCGLSIAFICGWRLLIQVFEKTSAIGSSGGILGKRTLIVGTDAKAVELLKKIRSRVGDGYEAIGFISSTHKEIGKLIADVPVLGSLENVGKVIHELQITDVIFAPEALNYGQILSVIAKGRTQPVNFHLVPSTMEVMVGKASVDSLDELPLVQITYGIDKPLNRLSKRVFDIFISGLLLCTAYPILYLIPKGFGKRRESFLTKLPMIFSGTWSFVGLPIAETPEQRRNDSTLFLGKPGLTGLVQLQNNRLLSEQEMEQYHLYYARNQSVLLDVEILIKTWLRRRHAASSHERTIRR